MNARDISGLLKGDLGTVGRLAERGLKVLDGLNAERDLYKHALQDIRDGRTNDAQYLAEETLRKGERL